jgi:hypothetical protein
MPKLRSTSHVSYDVTCWVHVDPPSRSGAGLAPRRSGSASHAPHLHRPQRQRDLSAGLAYCTHSSNQNGVCPHSTYGAYSHNSTWLVWAVVAAAESTRARSAAWMVSTVLSVFKAVCGPPQSAATFDTGGGASPVRTSHLPAPTHRQPWRRAARRRTCPATRPASRRLRTRVRSGSSLGAVLEHDGGCCC